MQARLYVMLLYTNIKKPNAYYLFLSHVIIMVSIVCIGCLCASMFVCEVICIRVETIINTHMRQNEQYQFDFFRFV